MIYTHFSSNITQGWHGSFHMLRCWGIEVKHYVFTPRRLAYESLRTIQLLRNLIKYNES